MDDHERLSGEFSAVIGPLLEKAHSLGYQIGSFRLEKHSEPVANIAPRDFSGCTIKCGPDADGHMVCKVHCP